MAKSSIYQRQSAEVTELFESAGNYKKVLIVAIDFASRKHLVLFCNGNGDQLLKPFPLKNNRDGFEYLLERIKTTCSRHGIKPRHVIVGGEDCPPYALNLLWAIHQEDRFCLVRVNAWKAKKQRENVQASSDKLDLLGIAKTIINRDAYPVFNDTEKLAKEIQSYDAMRELSRTRDALVEAETALSNQIHSVVKVLFPGFLDSSKKNPISAFCKTSLTLMERNDFHAGNYAKKSPAQLAKLLQKHGMHDSAQKAYNLIERAREELPPAPHAILYRQQCLQALISGYRQLQIKCKQLEEFEACALAGTPAAVLTSVSGIGIITAAGIGGEQGHADLLGPLHHQSSYAGIIPSTEQSGGPDNPAKTKKVKPRCNRRLKKHLVAAACRMGNTVGSPEFRAEYAALKAAEQHADFVMAKRFLRTAKALMTNRTIYLPPELRGVGFDKHSLCQYLETAWPRLREKWRTLKALDAAFADDAPLGIWRNTIQSMYQIDLPLERGGEVQLAAEEEFSETFN